MSAETQFRALLVGHAQTSALVGDRVAINAIGQGDAVPYIVFTAAHDIERNLAGDVIDDRVTFTTQCWADTAVGALAVAGAVQACIGSAPPELGVSVQALDTSYDPEAKLDSVTLTVEWWP